MVSLFAWIPARPRMEASIKGGCSGWGGNSHLLSTSYIQRQALAALFHAPHQYGALPVDKLSLSALDKPGNRLRLSILLIVCH